MSIVGIKTAILYSLPPCELGFCGPKQKQAKKILRQFILGKKVNIAKIKKALKNFEAAFPYYQLIAKANNIKDVFSKKVVEAYWLGNGLLKKVKYSDIIHLILSQFSQPGLLTLKEAQKRIKKIPKRAKAHHVFHVFILGPIAGRINFTPELLDLCRVSWGQIIKIEKNSKSLKVKVKTKTLIIQNGKYALGTKIIKQIEGNKHIFKNLKIGQWISFHWNQVCDVLNNQKVNALKYYTKIHLMNSTSNTGVKTSNKNLN